MYIYCNVLFSPVLRHESYLEDMYQEFGVINAVSTGVASLQKVGKERSRCKQDFIGGGNWEKAISRRQNLQYWLTQEQQRRETGSVCTSAY